jgi:hypothetical protein
VRHELKKLPLPLLMTGLLFGFVGLFSGQTIIGPAKLQEKEQFIRMIQEMTTDWIVFCMVACLGFAFTKEYFSFHRTDSFSRRLAFYRKLPITNREIVTARYVVMLINMIVLSVFYYVPFYLMMRLGNNVTGLEFTAAVLLWAGLSLISGGFFIYLELGYPGKKYLIFNMLVLGVILTVLVGLGLLNIHLVSGSFYLARHYAFYPSVLVILAGAAGAWLCAKKTVRRLDTRDLL